jgi:Alr-MurF fusion protein
LHYQLTDIARIIGTGNQPGHDTVIEHLLLDSRKVYAPASSLFFALKGPRRDGHQFINELYKKGVRNFVVSEKQEDALADANFLLVDDTLAALQRLAIHHRERFNIPVIGITGSNGKTIIKEWLYQLLKEDEQIVRSPKSFNSQIGVPLSVWQMDDQHTLAIFEAGISMTGEMEKLEKMIRPKIGVLTNIREAHSEGFKDNTEKFREKIKLFRDASCVVCHSAYDPGKVLDTLIEAQVYYCGEREDDDIRILSIEKQAASTIISVQAKAKFTNAVVQHAFTFTIPFTDEASIENAITCLGALWCLLPIVGKDKDTTLDTIVTRLAQLEPVEMRMQLKKGINNCYIINDSYSNDISSLGIALDYLKQQAGTQSTTVILSDILQSGRDEAALYTQVAAELKRRNVQRFIGIGQRLSAHFQVFKEVIPGSSFYLSTNSFLEEATSHQFRDDYILLKGARSFAFERISHWLEQKVHQTVLEINLNAVVHNLKEYQQLLQPATKVMAMVKAFAYGSGGAEIASVLQYHKVDYLGVAYADEGVELRRTGISLPVMVMNPEESSFEAIIENNLEPEIYSFGLLQSFSTFLEREGLQYYPVHIEIETGMNRLGFAAADMEQLAKRLKTTNAFKVQSIFSHLSASEEAAQDRFTMEQYERFMRAADTLQSILGYSFIRHIANSAAILRHPSLQLDMVRLGIGLYGVDSSASGKLNLETAAVLKSTVAQLKHLHAGDSVSYNRRGQVTRDSVIATVRIGYADGYPRRLGNGVGSMYVRGRLAPVIGTVCMDMTMIDVTGIPGVREGDDVIIFGKEMPVQQVAAQAQTIAYEIMTGISQRVKRVYFEE